MGGYIRKTQRIFSCPGSYARAGPSALADAAASVKSVHFPRALIARQKMMKRKAGEYRPTEVGNVAWITELVCKSNIFRTENVLSHTRRSFRSVAAEVAVSR